MTSTSRPVILVADDEAGVRMTVRLALSRFECEVLEAGDGEEALRAIEEKAPSAVVLDLAMPVLDGRAVLERLRENGSLPVLVLSAEGAQHVADEFGVDWMDKPFETEALAERVVSLLHREQVGNGDGRKPTGSEQRSPQRGGQAGTSYSA